MLEATHHHPTTRYSVSKIGRSQPRNLETGQQCFLFVRLSRPRSGDTVQRGDRTVEVVETVFTVFLVHL